MTALFDGRNATEHAAAAAEAARAINHITGWPAGLTYPSDAYQVLGDLARAAAMLPQACRQIADQLDDWHAAGLIGIDPATRYAGDPGAAVLATTSGLDEAATTARRVSAVLDDAAHALAWAHWTGPNLDDTDQAEARP